MGLPPPSNRSGPVPELSITTALESLLTVIIHELPDPWPPHVLDPDQLNPDPGPAISLNPDRIQALRNPEPVKRYFEETCNIFSLKKNFGVKNTISFFLTLKNDVKAPGEAARSPESS
jgi:hypothetical protein